MLKLGRRPGLALALALAITPTWAASAFAQDADARARFQRGEAAYHQGDYETAIREWTAAYEADPRPLLQYNLAQAYERLGRLPEAVQAYDRYMATASADDERRPDAQARLAALRARLGRTAVRIQGGPEGASIRVDGTDWGRTPRPDPIALAPGAHRIELRLSGYRDFVSTVVVPAGDVVDVPVEMVADDTGGGAPAGPSDGGGVPILPIVLMASGGGAVVIGSILGVLALGAASDAPTSDSPEADSARALALGADIAIGLGVIAAGVGVALLLIRPRAEERDPSVAIAPEVGPGTLGVHTSVRF